MTLGFKYHFKKTRKKRNKPIWVRCPFCKNERLTYAQDKAKCFICDRMIAIRFNRIDKKVI